MRPLIIGLPMLFFLGCSNNEKTPGAKANDKNNLAAPAIKMKIIVFFGNSLTAGYGLASPSEAFPALVQQKIDSIKLPCKVINAGVSGETTAGGNGRIDWILRGPLDVFILELGANDGLRGIPLSETKKNLQSIIDKVRAKNPQVKMVLAGMQIPPNMGQKYATEFRSIYPELATSNKITLVPFILEGVGGESRLNQEDGIHPTAEGHRLVAENVWNQLKPILQATTAP